MKKEELKSLTLNTKLHICYTYHKINFPEMYENTEHTFNSYKYQTYKDYKYSHSDYYNSFIVYIDELLLDYVNDTFFC